MAKHSGKFGDLVSKLKKKGIKNPSALAAFIGRKKFGKKKFQDKSRAGRIAALMRRAS